MTASAMILLLFGASQRSAVAANAAGGACNVEVSLDPGAGWPVKRQYLGCHSDSGYAFQPTALYSQLLFGGSFERGLWPASNQQKEFASVHANWSLGPPMVQPAQGGDKDNTAGSMQLVVGDTAVCDAPSGCLVAAANRGLGNSGLRLHGGKPYEGYFFARAGGSAGADGGSSSRDVALTVRLEDYTVGGITVLAEQQFRLNGDSSSWTMFNFTLVPSASTSCRFLDGPNETNGTDVQPCRGAASTRTETAAEHACILCGGQLTLGVTSSTGTAGVSFSTVHLQPGKWGRLPGLPVQRGSAQWLKDMGVGLFRMGGSFAIGSFWFWKNWIGPAWARPPASWGQGILTGWGPFEAMDMCDQLGCDFVMTTSASCATCGAATPKAMAELVEYALGGQDTTWGQKRIAHGHPAPYSLKYVELGNEQYNPDWGAQVTAMQQRAVELGHPDKLVYFWPKGACTHAQPNSPVSRGWPCPNQTMLDAVAGAGLGGTARLAFDAHPDGSRSHNINPATAELAADLSNPLYAGWGGGNFETNTGSHDFHHALDEGVDLNTFFNLPAALQPRVWGRAASFCMERSGYNEGGANDQGLIFFNQNHTYAQPGFFVHQMIAQTWHDLGVPVNLSSSCGRQPDDSRLGTAVGALSVSAQRSSAAGGTTGPVSVAFRIVNRQSSAVQLRLLVAGAAQQLYPQSMTVLQPPSTGPDGLFAVNSGRQPELVKPRTVPLSGKSGVPVEIPALSFAVLGALTSPHD